MRGVAFEYRAKRPEERWQRNWETAIFWTSLIPAFLWGVAFANIVRGVKIDRNLEYVGGVGDLLNPFALLGGLVTLTLFTFHGTVFTALKTVGDIRERARRLARWVGLLTAALALLFLVRAQIDQGDGKSLIALIVAVAALVLALVANQAGREGWAFALSGATVVAAVAMLFLTLFPNVMPSTLDADWSLTVSNASSSPYTLKIMTWCAGIATRSSCSTRDGRTGCSASASARSTSPTPQEPRTEFWSGRALPVKCPSPVRKGMFHVKPIDPRLLRYARATRLFLVAVVGLGAVGAALVIAQAMLISEVVVGAFQHHHSAAELRTPLLLLVAVAAGRAVVSWLTELAAHRASAAVKSELRRRLLERAGALGPGWLAGQRTGSLVALATRGVDALDDYFSRYLPQLGLAVVVPVAVLARIVTEDWVSAAIIVATLPLIPLFMMLIGWATQSQMDRQWRLLSRLSGHFLDVVAGLPTLKVFGRARAQAESIKRITGEYRRATMRTLRIAFLSSFALELLATISVALVAVTIGMRLVHGDMDLYIGLVILVLAPEAYLPLRQVGAQYQRRRRACPRRRRSSRCWRPPCPPAGPGGFRRGRSPSRA